MDRKLNDPSPVNNLADRLLIAVYHFFCSPPVNHLLTDYERSCNQLRTIEEIRAVFNGFPERNTAAFSAGSNCFRRVK